MSKYVDDSTYATIPGDLTVDWRKMRRFERELGLRARFLRILPIPDAAIAEFMRLGCCNPAVVVQTQPELLIAAYSDDHDWVLLLKFDQFFVQEYSLQPHTRLLSVNMYMREEPLMCDLQNGPNSTLLWSNFAPRIAEFCSSDHDTIQAKKQQCTEEEWRRTTELGFQILAEQRVIPRDGNPYRSGVPKPVSRLACLKCLHLFKRTCLPF